MRAPGPTTRLQFPRKLSVDLEKKNALFFTCTLRPYQFFFIYLRDNPTKALKPANQQLQIECVTVFDNGRKNQGGYTYKKKN